MPGMHGNCQVRLEFGPGEGGTRFQWPDGRVQRLTHRDGSLAAWEVSDTGLRFFWRRLGSLDDEVPAAIRVAPGASAPCAADGAADSTASAPRRRIRGKGPAAELLPATKRSRRTV